MGRGADSSSQDPYRQLNVYTEVLSRIKSDYVEDPDMKNVTLGAINGLLVSVDPFASYLNADQYKQYQKAATAKAGVGLILSRKYAYEISVVDSIPGSPADKAGLATGDIIESIAGIGTRDMPLAFTDVLLSGEPGTSVELNVLRLRKAEPMKVSLTRAVIQYPQVISKLIEPQLGYIQVRSLDAGKIDAVKTAVESLKKEGATKLILDLRHNAVGTPEEGVALARLFLEKGMIATMSGQRVPKQTFEADPSKVIWKEPLIVLTNRGTTGGAEVAAAALLDDKRAEVVGERTYGDAALRRPVLTEDGGAVLLAVAKFYTPAGKALQETSVTPTYQVLDSGDGAAEEEGEEPPAATPAPAPAKSQEDAVLQKAVDVIKGNVPRAKESAAKEPAVKPALPEKIPDAPLHIPNPTKQ
jgi:carboxyl-terminal processing protease